MNTSSTMPIKHVWGFLRKISLVFLFCVFHFAGIAQQDTLYYDAKWKPTVKDSAAFYRPPIQEEGNLFRVQDYYISGQLQMNAWSKNKTKDIWEGTVTWYNEDGSLFQKANYRDNRLEGEFISFLGEEKLVSNYANGYIVSGERNTPTGSLRMYLNKKGDSLKEIFYDEHINGIRYEYYSTKKNPRYLSKYYDTQGKLIGERTILPNGSYQGVEVFYYYQPMRVKEILYSPFGRQLLTATYYANGQIREEVKKDSTWIKTFYAKDGKEIGEVTYELDRDRLKPISGTEMFFVYGKRSEKTDLIQTSRSYENGTMTRETLHHDNGKLKSETTYKNGSRELQISYDEAGKEIARMVYKDYRPFEGTETRRDGKATYRQGELVEEIQYYPKSTLPQVRKTTVLETYYDKDANVLGELQLQDKDGYPTPFEGERYSMSYSDGSITSIDRYVQGVLAERTGYRKRLVGKDKHKTFKLIEQFAADGYEKVKEIRFYSNGKKQSEVLFKKYAETVGTFYDMEGNQIGTYDYEKKEGTLYKFFGDSDQIEQMEERKSGQTIRLKRYTYGKEKEYGQINPVLLEEIDANCCATFYSEDGEVLGKLTFKDQKPWEGMAYDYQKRSSYTFKEGKRNGPYKKLDYNGTVLEEGQYVADKEEGDFNYYSYKGVLKRTERFSKGVLNGVATYYDENGARLGTMTYDMGAPKNGDRITTGYGGFMNKETFVDGAMTRKETVDEDGKTVTSYDHGQILKSTTTVYNAETALKQLSYTTANGNLDGLVIAFNKTGKETRRAVFKKGKLISGTIRLLPSYQDNTIAYVELTRKANKLHVQFISLEGAVVLTAEEVLTPGSVVVYINKLNVDWEYIRPSILYRK